MAGLFDFDNFDFGDILKMPLTQLKADGNFVKDLFTDTKHAFGNHQDAMTDMQGSLGLNKDNKIVKNSDAIVGSIFGAMFAAPALGAAGGTAAGSGASGAASSGGMLSSIGSGMQTAGQVMGGANKISQGLQGQRNSLPTSSPVSATNTQAKASQGTELKPLSDSAKKYLERKEQNKGY